jgi:hypothetical protein
MKDAKQELEEEQINNEQEMGSDQVQGETPEKKHKLEGYKEHIESIITFNKGGDWKRIKSPDRDVEGRKYNCEENCFLNLFGISSDTPSFYSVDSAAGLIISNGSIGRYLTTDEKNISTFLSRDGGLNWFEIRKGSHIYEIGDHGALIVIADNKNPTSEILYSWDEGITFESLSISDKKFLIRNIIIEPSSTSQHFIIYGSNETKGNSHGIIIGVDFSGLHEPQCRNPDIPDTAESDYETWTPNDGRSGKACHMGHKTIYIRKKRESKCFNGQTLERKTIVEHCECSDADYECDFGFARVSIGEPCINTSTNHSTDDSTNNANHNIETEILTAPENCSGYYTVSKGYRKIPGNTCINGIKFDPLLIPCPFSGLFAHLGVIFFILIILVLIVGLIFMINKYHYTFIPNDFTGNLDKNNNNNHSYLNTNKRDYTDIVKLLKLILFKFYLCNLIFFRMMMIICYSMILKGIIN